MHKLTNDSLWYFLEPRATEFGEVFGKPSSDVYKNFRLPPRTAPLLVAILRQEGFYNSHYIDPNYHGKNGYLTKENLETAFKSDVLGIPSISRTSKQAVSIMRMYKSAKPEGIGILGPPHFNERLEDAFYLANADIVVLGEGDLTLRELARQFRIDTKNLGEIKGIAYIENGKIKINPQRNKMTEEEMDNLPYPYFDSFVIANANVDSITTSRGCRWNCKFCGVKKLFGDYRRHSIDYVIGRLKHSRLGKTNFWADDNLAGDDKEHVEQGKEMLRRVKKEGLQRSSSIAQFSAHAQEEFLRLAKEAGIDFSCTGTESFIDEKLRRLGKPSNSKKNIEALLRFRTIGQLVHGMMTFDSDYTSKELDEELENACRYFHTVQFFPTGPIPGTIFEKEVSSRILTKDYSKYGGAFLLVAPTKMSPFEYQMKIIEMYKRFYSREHFEKIKNDNLVRETGGIILYRNIQRGIMEELEGPEMKSYLEFLKSLS